MPDAEALHLKEIGLTSPDAVVRKGYVPDQIKAESDDEYTFVLSTGAVDRDGDTIKVSGWDLENYRKNPVVLFGHRSDIPPVAKAVTVSKSSGVLKARLKFPPPGDYDLADTVHALVKGGFLGATSVGFRPKRDKYAWNEERGGIDFEEQELLEFSIVPVPSNPEAVMQLGKDFAGASAAGIDLGPIRKALALAESADSKSITSAPNLGEGNDQRSCINCRYFSKPSDDHDGGVCNRHDFHSMEMWLCNDWETLAAGMPIPMSMGHTPDKLKAGRRLSAKTETSLRNAHASASKAVEHLQEALGDCEDEMEDGKAAPEPPKPVLYVTPAAAPPVYLVNPKDVQAAIAAAVTETVRSEVNRLRGRLD